MASGPSWSGSSGFWMCILPGVGRQRDRPNLILKGHHAVVQVAGDRPLGLNVETDQRLGRPCGGFAAFRFPPLRFPLDAVRSSPGPVQRHGPRRCPRSMSKFKRSASAGARSVLGRRSPEVLIRTSPGQAIRLGLGCDFMSASRKGSAKTTSNCSVSICWPCVLATTDSTNRPWYPRASRAATR